MTEVLHQVLPVAVFLVAITVTAEVAQLVGVFDGSEEHTSELQSH